MSYSNEDAKFVELSLGKTRYILEGKQECSHLVVLVHGIDVYSYHGHGLATRLLQEPDLTVLRYDLYGRGLSDAPSVNHTAEVFTTQLFELLNRLNFVQQDGSHPDVKISVAGHSMGGGICVAFAETYPHIVDQLILLTPAAVPFSVPFGFGLLKIPKIGGWIFSAMTSGGHEDMINQGFFDINASQEGIQWDVKWRSEMTSKQLSEAFTNSVRHFPLQGLSNAVNTIGSTQRNTLVAWAKYDTTVPGTDCFMKFWEAFKGNSNAHFLVFEKTRHDFFIERPIAYDLITTFVKTGSIDPTAIEPVGDQGEIEKSLSTSSDKKIHKWWNEEALDRIKQDPASSRFHFV